MLEIDVIVELSEPRHAASENIRKQVDGYLVKRLSRDIRDRISQSVGMPWDKLSAPLFIEYHKARFEEAFGS